jgi:hypothetical protein
MMKLVGAFSANLLYRSDTSWGGSLQNTSSLHIHMNCLFP